jgi:hypothetical protein
MIKMVQKRIFIKNELKIALMLEEN